jgi:hypothetical protein
MDYFEIEIEGKTMTGILLQCDEFYLLPHDAPIIDQPSLYGILRSYDVLEVAISETMPTFVEVTYAHNSPCPSSATHIPELNTSNPRIHFYGNIFKADNWIWDFLRRYANGGFLRDKVNWKEEGF